MSIFKSRKNWEKFSSSPISFYRTYYFGKRHDTIQCTTFKNTFWKMLAIWDTLVPRDLGQKLDNSIKAMGYMIRKRNIHNTHRGENI